MSFFSCCKNEIAVQVAAPPQKKVVRKQAVFLGGSCNPTTWRTDIAIPLLESSSVSFYNPQVADWKPELMALEATAKEEMEHLLFVLDNQTREDREGLDARPLVIPGCAVVSRDAPR